VNSSTFSSRRWLLIFFAILVPAGVGFLAASEWLIRVEVVPHDNFEWIAARLRDSQQSNAAFGDSHVAAVPDYNTKDFVNLGIGATTIRKMDQRVRYYFSKVKPGEVIIQADPHLFADYRLEARGNFVPEAYAESRLRVFDPRHRSFMLKYWSTLLRKGQLKEKENPSYDQLWQTANNLQNDAVKPAEEVAKPVAETAKPAEEAAKPLAEAAKPAPEAAKPLAETAKPPQGAAKSPEEAPKQSGETAEPLPSQPAVQPTTAGTVQENPAIADSAALSKFNAFMDYEVSTHTPVLNFRERDEANIYREMIKFLISRGATVCLVTYPVDKFYRERADVIPAYTEVRKFYKETAEENHIPYVSFWDRFDDPSMYQNTDHVNQNGSPILAREARQACFGKPGS
jgi:hypothetical protein